MPPSSFGLLRQIAVLAEEYCLFLVARYREELENGASRAEAIRLAIGNVGGALAVSKGSVLRVEFECALDPTTERRHRALRQDRQPIPPPLAVPDPKLASLANLPAFFTSDSNFFSP